MPRGFFGYNESRALVGSLPAWSPVVYLPWVLWGKIFGWNSISAVICNIFYFSAAVSSFVYLTRPSWKNLFSFMFIISVFSSIPFYLMNILPEIIITSFMILFFAFAFRMEKAKNKYINIVLMMVVAFLLVLVRPYLVLFFGLPLYYMIREKKYRRYLFIPILFVFGSLFGYWLLTHYFTSEYLLPPSGTEIIHKFLSFQFSDGFQMLTDTMKEFIDNLLLVLKTTILYGCVSGSHYFISLIVLVISLTLCFDKDNLEKRPVYLLFGIAMIALSMAILFLLQRTPVEGARYLFDFVVVGCLICAFCEWNTKTIAMKLILAVSLIILLFWGAFSPVDIKIPTDEGDLKASVEYWNERFVTQPIGREEGFGYENTVDWVYSDVVQDEFRGVRYGELFALPQWTGISCCTGDYITENISELKSKYIAAPCDGEVDRLCASSGWLEVGRTENVVIYSQQ